MKMSNTSTEEVSRKKSSGSTDCVDVTWRGRAFQVRQATIGKARSPTVDSRVRRTGSDDRNGRYFALQKLILIRYLLIITSW